MLACQIIMLFLFEFLTFRILMQKYGESCLKILWGNVFFFLLWIYVLSHFLKKTGQKCHFFSVFARRIKYVAWSNPEIVFVFFVQPQEAPFLNWGGICNLLSLHHATLSLFLSQAPTLTHSQTSVKKHYVSSDFHNPAAWPTESEVSLSLTRCTSCFLVYVASVLSLSGSDAVSCMFSFGYFGQRSSVLFGEIYSYIYQQIREGLGWKVG